MRANVIFFVIMLASIFVFGQDTAEMEDKNVSVKLNSEYSYLMMEHSQDLRKMNILLNARKDDLIKEGSLYLGASIISLMDYQNSNTDSKFGYLMRHPTSNNQIGETVSEAVVHSVQLSLTGTVNSWLTVYAEMLYDPQQSFGPGTITSLGRNQIQLRKGVVLVGDLNKAPVFLALGKLDTPFGQTGSVSPFTNSTMWHAFGGLGYGAQFGFTKSGFDASIMLVQGGPQFRALNTPVEGTTVPSKLNNFVLDASYELDFSETVKAQVGASYVKGSAYCHSWPVVHFNTCEDSNPATSFYGNIRINNQFTLKGSFAFTSDVWPGTFNPNAPLNEFEASDVTSLDIGARYDLNNTGDIKYSLSAEFSNFVAGPEGSPWERQNQTVIGFSGMIKNSSKLFFEFFNTKGYVPLNFLSGGNFDNPGETHSVNDASSFGIVIGGHLTI